MHAKIHNGKGYGAVFTSAERKAMDAEIKRQLAEYDKKHEIEIDAMVLYILCEHFGFREKRLRKFFDIFGREMDALRERYQMEDTDEVWLCTYNLKKRGIDISEWRKENGVT